MVPHYYPPNHFNGKVFSYYRCKSCDSLVVSPLPAKEDMDRIYGVSDHSYLLKLKEGEPLQFDLQYPFGHYQRYEAEFLKEALPLLNGKKLLDYGCGSGHYLAYARSLGLDATGVEYNLEFCELLRSKNGLPIYSHEEFEAKFKNETFDVIHFGHVLEHLPDPYDAVLRMRKYAHSETLFIIDGPLENNTYFTHFVIGAVSRIKSKTHNEYAPQHLSFTTYKSQLMFFERLGMKTIRYKAAGQFWPLPDRVRSLGDIPKYAVARLSVALAQVFKKQGNVFHYVGKFS